MTVAGMDADASRSGGLLRPTEAVRFINSTPLGSVCDEWSVRRDMGDLGVRIAPDGRRVDSLKYASWLLHRRHIEGSTPGLFPGVEPSDGGSYERHRDRMGARSRDLSLSRREIGPIPPIGNAKRRAKAGKSLRVFCETYFPRLFRRKWSRTHLKLLADLDKTIRDGGQKAYAIWRGFGKSTILEVATLFATLYGFRRFVLFLSQSRDKAALSAASILTQIEKNPLLAEDFPEVCFPIKKLEGIANRAAGQLCNGERTHLGIEAKKIVFPLIPDAPSSAATIQAAGLDGDFRGSFLTRADGERVRPDMVVVDDAQTDKSARSEKRCEEREQLIQGAVLGLGDHETRSAVFMACTVIRENDLSSRYIDHKRHPDWRGVRARLMNTMPTNEELWHEYNSIRAQDILDEKGFTRCNAFYRKNRKSMDAGADPEWPDAWDRTNELSAVQHAMNILAERKEEAFWAEYQNEPIPAQAEETTDLSKELLATRLNHRARGTVPIEATTLTAFIDVQHKLLPWVVCAFGDEFTGYVIDYGTWPDQRSPRWTRRKAQYTIDREFPSAKMLEGRIYSALDRLTGELLDRAFRRGDGTDAKIDRLLIDANDGNLDAVVYQFCRQSRHGPRVMPSRTKGYGPGGPEWNPARRAPGERVGLHWRIPVAKGRELRHVHWDTNWWKTFTATRLRTTVGDPGAMTICGARAGEHDTFFDHLISEQGLILQDKKSGRSGEVWKPKRLNIENDLWDCLVGCVMGASMQGVSIRAIGQSAPAVMTRKRIKLGELQRNRR